MSNIVDYIKKRNNAIYIGKIINIPWFICLNIEQVIYSRKSTRYQEDYIIRMCKRIQESIDEKVSKLKSFDINISYKIVDRIKNLNIEKLIDCNELAEVLSEMSTEIRNQSKLGFMCECVEIGGVYFLLQEILFLLILAGVSVWWYAA